jgi:hypothetical protein
MKSNIHNAVLVLGGVSITDVYINAHTFPHEKELYENARNDVINQLSTKGYRFSEDYHNHKALTTFSRSGSSYSKITSRDVFLHTQLPNLKTKIESELISEIEFEDVFILFYNSGNAVIVASVKFSNVEFDLKQYKAVTKQAHTFFPKLYRQIAIDHCLAYYKIMSTNFPASTKISLTELTASDSSSENRILKNTLNFSIYNHYLFEKTCFDNPNTINQMIQDEECLNNLKSVSLKDSKVIYGYTHSFYLFENIEFKNQIDLYKLPLINVLADWATIRGITFEIDELSNACKCSLKGKFIISSYNKMKRYLIKIEEMYAEFDCYSSTNNPVYYNLIEQYQEAFGEPQHIKRLSDKIAQVDKFLLTIYSQRVEIATKFTDAILLLIACTAIFGFVKFNLKNLAILLAVIYVFFMIRKHIMNRRVKL